MMMTVCRDYAITSGNRPTRELSEYRFKNRLITGRRVPP